MSNDYQGSLISIEGVDGAGKGTVIEKLQGEHFPEFEYTREPSDGQYGRIVREELRSDNDPSVSDFFLFCADRYDHCNSLIGPKIDNGETVLTDRYNLSTYAYQTKVIAEQLDVPFPEAYIDAILDRFVIEPDLTIIIDAPVEETFDRLDDEKEKYEKVDRLREARQTYLSFAMNNDYIEVVDGTQDAEDVIQDCVELINEV